MKRRIFVMGGGGFSQEPDNPLLDDYLLGLTGKQTPRVCFVPTAGGDNADYIRRFEAAFPEIRAETSVLSLFSRDSRVDLSTCLLGQDIVYVGGGSTVNALAVWRAHRLDEALRHALSKGVICAGVSAGMNCWFDSFITDSFGALVPQFNGLGFLTGSSCPSYDVEAAKIYRGWIADGFPAGYGVERSCGLLFEDDELVEAVSSVEGAAAYYVSSGVNGVTERPLPVRFLG